MDSNGTPAITIEPNDLGVCIHWPQENIRFQHSFVEGDLVRRAKQSNQGILKACSNRKKNVSRILDLTGGWGQDSLILASHDKQVTLIEKHEVVFEVVEHSLRVLKEKQPESRLLDNLNLVCSNAVDYLEQTYTAEFDCIYLDPMFPSHKSGAKPSKSLQLLQQLTNNEDIDSTFELALRKAGNRVVVKRPLKAPTLSTLEPDLCIREKTIRFDIYLARSS